MQVKIGGWNKSKLVKQEGGVVFKVMSFTNFRAIESWKLQNYELFTCFNKSDFSS